MLGSGSMNLTYRELLGFLNKLTDEQLDCNVSIYIRSSDEWVPCVGFDEDVLDKNHPFMEIEG